MPDDDPRQPLADDEHRRQPPPRRILPDPSLFVRQSSLDSDQSEPNMSWIRLRSSPSQQHKRHHSCGDAESSPERRSKGSLPRSFKRRNAVQATVSDPRRADVTSSRRKADVNSNEAIAGSFTSRTTSASSEWSEWQSSSNLESVFDSPDRGEATCVMDKFRNALAYDVIGQTATARFPWLRDVGIQCNLTDIQSAGSACVEVSAVESDDSRKTEDLGVIKPRQIAKLRPVRSYSDPNSPSVQRKHCSNRERARRRGITFSEFRMDLQNARRNAG